MTDTSVRLVVVMGVSGSGKSTVGALLADALGVCFVDADDLHPLANVTKMAAGIPLDDDDRWPWLDRVGRMLSEREAAGTVIACSALKRSYRDAIRRRAPAARFVQLDGGRDILVGRLGQRRGHFMPSALLDSQRRTLEPLGLDEAGIRVDIRQPPQAIVTEVLARLNAEATQGAAPAVGASTHPSDEQMMQA